MVLPTLALSNPVNTTPTAPLPSDPLLPQVYPPPPGLPPLFPDTDQPNILLQETVSAPTVPVAPTRRSPRPHIPRIIPSYSAVTVPALPYIAIVQGDNDTINSVSHLSRSEVAELISSATAAWCSTIDHVARANSTTSETYIASVQKDITHDNINSIPVARPLNVNLDGTPLTFRTAMHGPERPD